MKIKTLAISLFFCGHAIASNNPIHSQLCFRGECPTTSEERNIVLDHNVYILDMNCRTKFADWVAYVVDRNNINHHTKNRHWKTDEKLPKDCSMEPKDYDYAYLNYEYEHGHMAPLSSFGGTAYWSDTNYLSNIEPQKSDLNEGPWSRLENHVRDLAKSYQYVYVITGPVYSKPMDGLPSKKDAVVPSAFFKVIIKPNTYNKIEAYLMPQSAKKHDEYSDYRATVPEIEKATGLILLGE